MIIKLTLVQKCVLIRSNLKLIFTQMILGNVFFKCDDSVLAGVLYCSFIEDF